MTLHFQNQSPGADQETNWVPTPNDEFSLYIRAYWPTRWPLDAAPSAASELNARKLPLFSPRPCLLMAHYDMLRFGH